MGQTGAETPPEDLGAHEPKFGEAGAGIVCGCCPTTRASVRKARQLIAEAVNA